MSSSSMLQRQYRHKHFRVLTQIKRISFAASALLFAGLSNAAGIDQRIVGGSLVEDEKYPFMASIYFRSDVDNRFYPGCGGSHLGDGWILTAAHCLLDPTTGEVLDTDNVSVLLGTNDLRDEEGFFTRSSQILVHPDYDGELFTDDIALIRMSENFDGAVITLPSAQSRLPAIGEQATVAGWGHTEEGGELSVLLQEVTIPVVSHAGCLPFFGESFDRDKNFCAGGGADGSKDACQGDSGGPIFVARDQLWIQAGIVSNGLGCGRSGIPALYTLVSSNTDWILATVSSAFVWQDVGSNNLADADIPVLAPENLVDDMVLLGASQVFEITGATRVELTTQSGDADLFVYSGSDFRSATLDCVSNEFAEDSALDTCDITTSAPFQYAVVFGFEESGYQLITRINNEIDDDVPVIPATVPDATPLASSGGGGGGGSAGAILILALAGLSITRRQREHANN